MLLTITATCQPATEPGYLLHKNPVCVQSFPLSFGQAHVFYQQASNEPCAASMHVPSASSPAKASRSIPVC